ncbi:kelch-like protein diablo [Lineus longissimus]|uniref:kelch-like protein diablo n=1 Tax=Lineus longissimus TaxID=88925 RepID=UPI00315DBADE
MTDMAEFRGVGRSPEEEQHFGAKVMESQNYAAAMLSGLERLHQDDLLCDLTLKAQETSVRVHKVVLVSNSDYFYTMLTGSFLETGKDVIELKGVSGRSLETIVSFLYTGKLKLSKENIIEIIAGANHMQILEALDLCMRFIMENLRRSSYIRDLEIADFYSLEKLQDYICDVMAKEFRFYMTECVTEYLELPVKYLLKIIAHDNLWIESEYNLFMHVTKWICHDFKTRSQWLPQLMEKVRFPIMSLKEIHHASKNGIIQKHSRCKELIEEGKHYHKPSEVIRRPLLANERTKIRNPELSFILYSHDTVEGYEMHPCFTKGKVTLLDGFDDWGSAMLCARSFLYTCGVKFEPDPSEEPGPVHDNYIPYFLRYDPSTKQWVNLEPMSQVRYWCELVELNHCIYAIGGQEHGHLHEGICPRAVEVYSVAQNMWSAVKCLPPPAVRAKGLCAAACDSKIFVAFWERMPDTHPKNRMYSYDILKDDWLEVTGIPPHHFARGMVGIGSFIYRIAKNKVYMYNPRTNLWTSCTPVRELKDYNADLQLCSHQGQMYIIAKETISDRTNMHDVYDDFDRSDRTERGVVCHIVAYDIHENKTKTIRKLGINKHRIKNLNHSLMMDLPRSLFTFH